MHELWNSVRDAHDTSRWSHNLAELNVCVCVCSTAALCTLKSQRTTQHIHTHTHSCHTMPLPCSISLAIFSFSFFFFSRVLPLRRQKRTRSEKHSHHYISNCAVFFGVEIKFICIIRWFFRVCHIILSVYCVDWWLHCHGVRIRVARPDHHLCM